jgi:hypothetical protein
MHVMAVLDAIKKCGLFKDYEKAQKAHVEAKKVVELVEAGLALLDGTSTGSKKNCKKKALAKAKEATKEALAKTPETKSETKEAKEVTRVTKNTMKAGFQADLEKAKKAVEDAKGAMTTAASQKFAFYLNLLSPESKYLWNKIVRKQLESNPFVNLKGVSLEGPRGMSCKSFSNCVIFHLLTAFPINVAEQEKYYITNVLKKPQCVNVCQFVRHVEQLNIYIAQMPCFYYSPNANASTKPKNVPFTEAELRSHVLHMCPIQLQDQYNMNKKGMMPMDMCLLLTLLEAIKCICTYRMANRNLPRSLPTRARKRRNALVPTLWPGFPRKSVLRRTMTCARSMVVCTPRTTLVIVVGLRRTERRSLISVPIRKVERKQIP